MFTAAELVAAAKVWLLAWSKRALAAGVLLHLEWMPPITGQ